MNALAEKSIHLVAAGLGTTLFLHNDIGWAALLLGAYTGGLIYFFHARIYILLNSCVNGLGHKAPGQTDKPEKPGRNVGWLAWLTAGEGWHGNHHDSPGSARLGSVDLGWLVIWVLQKLRLAKTK